jgi:hypothetical protein
MMYCSTFFSEGRDCQFYRGLIFTRPKRRMKSTLAVFILMIVGFGVYFFSRDYFFDSNETFLTTVAPSLPAPASIVIRQAPTYPERVITPSGPSPPSASSASSASSSEVTLYGPPVPNDPYHESQENSTIPETLRHPERAYRAPPSNQNTSIAIHSGIASPSVAVSSDESSSMNPEMIQNGGEFLSGVFANDTFQDTAYSSF